MKKSVVSSRQSKSRKSIIRNIKSMIKKKSRKSVKRYRSLKKVRKSREKIYCGDKRKSPSNYSRLGTRYECMKKGFGAGSYSERERIIYYLEELEDKSSKKKRVQTKNKTKK